MKITLKGIPPSLNKVIGRENVWAYRTAKKQWTEAVMWAVKASKEKPKEPFEHSHITITYYFPTHARHDADNFAGKFLLDGLTKSGVIVDDDLKHITTTIRGEYDKENPRTEIEIVEVDHVQS